MENGVLYKNTMEDIVMKLSRKIIAAIILTVFVLTNSNYANISAAEKQYGIGGPHIEENVVICGSEKIADNEKLTNPVTKATIKTWNTITFGNYPQSLYKPKQSPTNPIDGKTYIDSDGTKMVYKNSKCFKVEPIKWRVISVDENDAFLLAEKCLDSQPYNKEETAVTWETCSLRTWLNNDFFNRAFSSEEQAVIKETTVVNNDTPNSDNDKKDIINTSDKIYLLSLAESQNVKYGFSEGYNVTNQAREAEITSYGNGGHYYEWWLRNSSMSNPSCVYTVEQNGEIDDNALCDNDAGNVGVRPVLHINLDTSLWKLDENVTAKEKFISTWDVISFGSYPQRKYIPKRAPANPVSGEIYTDSDGTRMVYKEWKESVLKSGTPDDGEYIKIPHNEYFKFEPIKWCVLSVNGNDAFILAEKCLDYQKYNKKQDAVTWENCTLRAWLNSTFLNNAFTSEERSAIQSTSVINKDNIYYKNDGNGNPKGGNDTTDSLYLLSLDEAENGTYGFWGKESLTRIVKKTAYVKTCEMTGDVTNWWLRSPGEYNICALNVADDGYILYGGYYVDYNSGIRPVLHLKLNSSAWKKTGIVTSGENTEEDDDTISMPSSSVTAKPTASTHSGAASAKRITKPAKVKLIVAKNQKSKKISLKWKKISGAKGYQIQYATNKKFKSKKTKTTTKLRYTIKKLKKKKTYYVRVRAYKSSKKKVYGKWSNVKKIKVKK